MKTKLWLQPAYLVSAVEFSPIGRLAWRIEVNYFQTLQRKRATGDWCAKKISSTPATAFRPRGLAMS